MNGIWQPSDGIVLEPAAQRALEFEGNILVIAGPGAGKTELLAQKASYLFKTNKCAYPQRILAISFKVDAAKNLKERVVERVDKDLAYRFNSLTFHAFALKILSQFRNMLPDKYALAREYKILQTISRKRNKNNEIQEITFKEVLELAKKIVELNPIVAEVIRMTYSHVFIDEFQDTTDEQYELLKSIFLNSSSYLTAVGDRKQAIMKWAGAVPTILEDFQKEFDATNEYLIENFRSTSELSSAQTVVATRMLNNERELLASQIEIKSYEKVNKESDRFILYFPNEELEGEYLVNYIKKILEEGIEGRDICILTKQQENIYAAKIVKKLKERNINARWEKEYQEFLSDDLFLLILDLFKVSEEKCVKSWMEVLLQTQSILGIDTLGSLQQEKDLKELLKEIQLLYKKIDDSTVEETFQKMTERVLVFLKRENIYSTYRKYSEKRELNKLCDEIAMMLTSHYYEGATLSSLVRDIKGAESIPVMTVHKSKGMEFHTVIFVGLEDAAFWEMEKDNNEDNWKLLFVALSRAKVNMIFTYSAKRTIKQYEKMVYNSSTLKNVGEMHSLLKKAGFQEVRPECVYK